jgi:hypothetical protein
VDGELVSQLDGCTDVDFGWTPATNTVPIRRLGLEVGQRASITAAWIRFPELDVVASEQWYRDLESAPADSRSAGSWMTARTRASPGVDEVAASTWSRVSVTTADAARRRIPQAVASSIRLAAVTFRTSAASAAAVWVTSAAVGEAEVLELRTFPQLAVGSDDGEQAGRELAAVVGEGGGEGSEGRGDGLDRRGRIGHRGDRVGQDLAVRGLAREQHLPLVGEVPGEGHLGQSAGSVGDLADGGGVVALLGEQVEGSPYQPFSRVRFPSGHEDRMPRSCSCVFSSPAPAVTSARLWCPNLREAAAGADAVVHLAFDHETMFAGNFAGAVATDLAVVQAFGVALARAIAGFTERGVRTILVAIPPLTHSSRDKQGFIPILINIARNTGVSGYVGEGANRWAAAHTLDVAVLYRLALEAAPAGSQWYAAAEEGITVREIAEVIGRHLGLPAGSVPAADAADHLKGFPSSRWTSRCLTRTPGSSSAGSGPTPGSSPTSTRATTSPPTEDRVPRRWHRGSFGMKRFEDRRYLRVVRRPGGTRRVIAASGC